MINFLSLLLPLFLFSFARISSAPLTLEEKVGQMMMVFFYGSEANEEARKLIEEAHVGGIIYYNWANELSSPQQVQQLSNGLQQLAKNRENSIPLLIAIDQEGGPVVRLKEGFTPFPGNYRLGEIGNPQIVFQVSQAMGKEMLAVGVNMNLAPVVDVSTSFQSVLRKRTYGTSPEHTSQLAKAAINGYKASGIVATLKHFPGYGDAQIDPHLGLPVVRKSLAGVQAVELYPFKELVKDADAIMSAHILIPVLDPRHCATLSSLILEDLLRKEWGYEGVVISDSLSMQGVLDECGDIAEAAVRAIQAGNDILIIGGKKLSERNQPEEESDEFFKIYHYILNAVTTGRLSEERIDASVQRILQLKRKYQLSEQAFHFPNDISQHVNNASHQELLRELEEK